MTLSTNRESDMNLLNTDRTYATRENAIKALELGCKKKDEAVINDPIKECSMTIYKVKKQQGSKRWGVYRIEPPFKIAVLIEGGFFNREVAVLIARQYKRRTR